MSYLSNLAVFQDLGCKDEQKIALACRVYTKLSEEKTITNLEKCYNSDLNIIYLRGTRAAQDELFLPLLHTEQIDMKIVEQMQQHISSNKTVTVAICDTSSNILYYKMTGELKKTDLSAFKPNKKPICKSKSKNPTSSSSAVDEIGPQTSKSINLIPQ